VPSTDAACAHCHATHNVGSPQLCYAPGHLAHIFFLSFLTDIYLYDHMTSTHMTAYLYIRAFLLGTSLFSPFVHFLLFSLYGSL